uniref:DUF938 domain-containing protein n=1 Tax=Caenorhabditis tropicalis TaxID=1561998 RepID=A0A1I7V3I0_9PELO
MLRAPAAESNKDVILEVLKRFATAGKKVFEIASGTGQHVTHFARALPDVTFQPSEVDGRSLHSIVSYLDQSQLQNIRIPLFIDVAKSFDQWALPADFGPHMVDIILNINMLHICSNAAVKGLFESANQLLNETSGILMTYGPYCENGHISPQSNITFHASLRNQNPEYGLKDIKFLERIIPYLPFLLTYTAYHMLLKQLKQRQESTKNVVEINIIGNAQFTNDCYNWDSVYLSKYSHLSVKKSPWWRRNKVESHK